MNATQRKKLQKAFQMLEDAKNVIELISEQEREKFENLSESLQDSDRGQQIDENADLLYDISCDLENLMDNLSNLI